MRTKNKEEQFIFSLVDMANFLEEWGVEYVMKELQQFDSIVHTNLQRHFQMDSTTKRVAALLRDFDVA